MTIVNGHTGVTRMVDGKIRTKRTHHVAVVTEVGTVFLLLVLPSNKIP